MNVELFTVEQAAVYLQVSTKTIRRLIKSENLLASKVGRAWRIKKHDIETYLTQNMNQSEGVDNHE